VQCIVAVRGLWVSERNTKIERIEMDREREEERERIEREERGREREEKRREEKRREERERAMTRIRNHTAVQSRRSCPKTVEWDTTVRTQNARGCIGTCSSIHRAPII
jgi:hypothetical protein